MSQQMTQAEIDEYKEAFQLFDSDGDNMITTEELGTALRSLGARLTESELSNLKRSADPNNTGSVDFNSFLKIAGSTKNQGVNYEELLEAMNVFDKEGNGYIPAEEFKRIMMSLGEKMTEYEADELIKESADSSGHISCETLAMKLANV
ncbi:calmodulin-like 3 [Mycoemilia scoparia]|uniref:Calmodulin-like 3 n=1 Tax=Mycoemilia scoparia TaxID=417184 RepID=A0A9W8DSS8_9FUNG|nr:calmodulin-like 3 [Mycoemilia scoparia]